MANTIYRPIVAGDETQLKHIWLQAYDNDAVSATLFFGRVYRPGNGVVADRDGTLCSAIYLMDGFHLHGFSDRPLTATYLYALGTPPEYRSQGLGGSTIRAAGQLAYDLGAEFVCFMPATESLADWYGRILDTRAVFYHRVAEVTSEAKPVGGTMGELTPSDYAAKREQLLRNTPHTELPLDALGLQRQFCQQNGGGFYYLSIAGQEAICAVDRYHDRLTVRELLVPGGDPVIFSRFLLKQFGCPSAEIRTPAFCHPEFGTVQADCVLIPPEHPLPETQVPPYWGLFLD